MSIVRTQSRSNTASSQDISNTNNENTRTYLEVNDDTVGFAIDYSEDNTFHDHDYDYDDDLAPIPIPPPSRRPAPIMDLVDLNSPGDAYEPSPSPSPSTSPDPELPRVRPPTPTPTSPPPPRKSLRQSRRSHLPTPDNQSRPSTTNLPPTTSPKRYPNLSPFARLDKEPAAPTVGLNTTRAVGAASKPGHQPESVAVREGERESVRSWILHHHDSPTEDEMDLGTNESKEQHATATDQTRLQHQTQAISWSGWDSTWEGSKSHRLLLLAHSRPPALSVWDCSRLDAIAGVIRVEMTVLMGNISGEPGGEEWDLVSAAILPYAPRTGPDFWKAERPVLGILIRPCLDHTSTIPGKLIVYSLATFQVLQRIDIPGISAGKTKGSPRAESFETSDAGFVVISVSSPSEVSLHIFATSPPFDLLHTISASKLTPYVPPAAASSTFAFPVDKVTASMVGAGVLGRLGIGVRSPDLNLRGIDDQEKRRRMSHGDVSGRRADGYGYGYGHSGDQPLTPGFGEQEEELSHRRRRSRPHSQQQQPTPQRLPRAVYALSHRLLAFASPASLGSLSTSGAPTTPPLSSSPGSGAPSPLAKGTPGTAGPPSAGLGFGTGIAGLPSTQAELGTAAIKVGGSVWGGVRMLGGMAVEAARRTSVGETTLGTGMGRLFSRSAPEGSVWVKDAADPTADGERKAGEENVSEVWGVTQEGGFSVTVIDLASLVGVGTQQQQSAPLVVAEFMVSKDKQVSKLAFSADGCSLVVVPRDGHAGRVFRISAGPRQRDGDAGATTASQEPPPPWHQYNLRRGRTSAVVEAVNWAADGRWVAVASRRRTLHVFGLNLFGGKVDGRFLVEGRSNSEDFHFLAKPVELTPLVRLRVAAQGEPSKPQPPLSFVFLKPLESATLPSHLLPLPHPAHSHTFTTPPHSHASLASHSDASSSPPISPRKLPATFGGPGAKSRSQDILLFDPVEGTLSLRRITMELQVKDHGFPSGLSGTSVSLPGVPGAAGWIAGTGGSPSSLGKGGTSSPDAGAAKSGKGPIGEMELVAKENTVMMWNLKKSWEEVESKKGLTSWKEAPVRRRINPLAQAELSTFSRSKRILPRSIYLSHQFSFHTLGEDYHALIRRYQFSIVGDKIDVRRAVQVSAYPAGGGELFVEGFAGPHDGPRGAHVSSSFDGPLASALSAEFNQPHTSGILPMLPNGSRPQMFGSSLPITIRGMAGIGDGMSEGFGRIRREINRVRSPKLKPHRDSSLSPSVPLEFDEEDEDFLDPEAGGPNVLEISHPVEVEHSVSRETSQGRSSRQGVSSTPPTSGLDEEDAGSDGAWDGWTSRDKLIVEEQEKFDDIDVVGLLNEEERQERRIRNLRDLSEKRVEKREGRKRGRV